LTQDPCSGAAEVEGKLETFARKEFFSLVPTRIIMANSDIGPTSV